MTHLEYLKERIRIELEILVDYIFHVRFVRFPLLLILRKHIRINDIYLGYAIK